MSNRMTMRATIIYVTTVLLGVLLAPPVGVSAQYSEMTQERFNRVMESGIEIEGTLHARVGLRSGPFVQLGVSDLRWTSFDYNGLNYTYEELRRFFGDQIPSEEITKGHAKFEAQVTSVIACGYYFHFEKLINFRMSRVSELEDGVFNGILNEYTHHIDDTELPDEDTERHAAQCIRRNEGHAIDLNILSITGHYFPDREHGDRYENVLRKLLDERAERMAEEEQEAEEEEEAREAAESEEEAASSSGSGEADSGGRKYESVAEMRERHEREREADEARREQMSEEERRRDTQMSLFRMATEQALKGERLAAQGDYQGAIEAYKRANEIKPDPRYDDRIEQLGMSAATQALSTAAVGMLSMDVADPRGTNRFSGASGFIISPGARVQSTEGVLVTSIPFDVLRLIPFDPDRWWRDVGSINDYGVMGTLELQTELWMTERACGNSDGTSDCTVGDLVDAWGVSLRPFVGLTYKGWFGGGLGVDGAYVGGRSEPEPIAGVEFGDDDYEYDDVGPGHMIWQPAGTLWVGPRYKGEFVWKAYMTATGAPFENRMVGGPYLSEVIYRLNVRYNFLGFTVGKRSVTYHGGVDPTAEPLTSDGVFFGVLFGG